MIEQILAVCALLATLAAGFIGEKVACPPDHPERCPPASKP